MKEADHGRGRGSEQQRGCIARAWGKRLEEVLFYRIAGGRTAGIDPLQGLSGSSETTFRVTVTSNGLMGAAEKGPIETEETREGRFFKQVKEKSAYFRDAERNHHGQTSPRCRLKALRL